MKLTRLLFSTLLALASITAPVAADTLSVGTVKGSSIVTTNSPLDIKFFDWPAISAGQVYRRTASLSAPFEGLTLGTLATQNGTFSGTSSGTNTGDNAVNSLYSGLVSNATHTGDATGATVLTLATVNSNLGSFGSTSTIPTFTVNAKGLITAASSNSIAAPWSGITGTPTTLSGYGISDAQPLNAKLTAFGALANGSGVLTNNGSGTLTWAASGGTGTVTSVSVTSANGFAGSVATSTVTPAITISTSVTGLLKGNGTAISAATSGTDYVVPSGNVATATLLQNARIINGVSFNGGANIGQDLQTSASPSFTAMSFPFAGVIKADGGVFRIGQTNGGEEFDMFSGGSAGIGIDSANIGGASEFWFFKDAETVFDGTKLIGVSEAGILMIGGNDSNFPGLGHDSEELQARLADNSGFAGFHAAAITSDGGYNGSFTGLPCEFQIACSDLTTAITAGTNKGYFRAPFAFTLAEVRVSLIDAPTGSSMLVDVNEAGTTVLSTKAMVDAGEETSQTATTPYVISDSSIADDAKITFDFDQVGATNPGKGVIITLIGHRN